MTKAWQFGLLNRLGKTKDGFPKSPDKLWRDPSKSTVTAEGLLALFGADKHTVDLRKSKKA